MPLKPKEKQGKETSKNTKNNSVNKTNSSSQTGGHSAFRNNTQKQVNEIIEMDRHYK